MITPFLRNYTNIQLVAGFTTNRSVSRIVLHELNNLDQVSENSQRYKEFDITALADVATEAVGSRCTSISKGIEGQWLFLSIIEYMETQKSHRILQQGVLP